MIPSSSNASRMSPDVNTSDPYTTRNFRIDCKRKGHRPEIRPSMHATDKGGDRGHQSCLITRFYMSQTMSSMY
jgi:hypothetical protein